MWSFREGDEWLGYTWLIYREMLKKMDSTIWNVYLFCILCFFSTKMSAVDMVRSICGVEFDSISIIKSYWEQSCDKIAFWRINVAHHVLLAHRHSIGAAYCYDFNCPKRFQELQLPFEWCETNDGGIPPAQIPPAQVGSRISRYNILDACQSG